MSLKFPRIQPAWAYRDPAEFVVFGVSLQPTSPAPIEHHQRPRVWDRHYREARRLHVKQLMQKGRT